MSNYDCPLCSDTYDERMELRVHLEVQHRKSEIVSHLVEFSAAESEADDVPLEDEVPTSPA